MSVAEVSSTAKCCWCQAPLKRESVNGPWWCLTEACKTHQVNWSRYTCQTNKHGEIPGSRRYLYVPTPVQVEWHRAVYNRDLVYLLVGGQAGPGKSRWIREALYRLACEVPGLHALLLRRTHKDLDQSHLRFMPYEVHSAGGEYKIGDRVALFHHRDQPDAVIRCGHLEDAGAIENYLSSEYDVIAPDELVTFDRDPMLELFSRLRSTSPKLMKLRGHVDADLDGSCVITATNPGGRGSLWVKDFFIDHNPDEEEFPDYEPHRWAFVPAKLDDNPYIRKGYRKKLENLTGPRRRQLLEGDWNAHSGQFFTEWREDKHVREVEIPRHTEFFGSMDWGRNAPGVMLWWACLPDGHFHIAAEYKFQGENADEVGIQIQRQTKALHITRLRYIVCDPNMKSKSGHSRGESIMETLQRLQLPMRLGDNDRNNGWNRVHELLRPDVDGVPWLTVSPLCRYGRRTIPAMVMDKHDPEDLDTTKDDHWCDALRYGAMSRPAPTRFVDVKPAPPPGSIGDMLAALLTPPTPILGTDLARG